MIRPLLVLIALWLPLSTQASTDAHAAQVLLRARIEQLHSTATSRPIVGDLTLTQAIAATYKQHDFALLWREPARLQQLIEAIESTAADGLDPAEYHVAQLRSALAQLHEASAAAQIEADLLASDAYWRALSHLLRGKVDPKVLDARWDFAINPLTPAQLLQTANAAIDNNSIVAAFAQARPQHALYANLRQALTQLRARSADGGWPLLPDGAALKPAMRDARVPLLRQRLNAAGLLQANDGSDRYDAAMVGAVKQFQREQLEEPDGVVGRATRAALNIPLAERIEQARADLERGRWLLHGIDGNFVVVNAAAYSIRYFRGDAVVWQARTQVGMRERETPIFKSKITRVTFNPDWTVPPTILRKDILPKILSNPNYLHDNHFQVFDAREQVLAPEQVDWHNPGAITLRQDAGEGSALGRAAIRFNNPFSIYMHDTPHQELFDSKQRAFSSGCIRVERALELVELLFNDEERWNRDAIDAVLASEKTRNVTLPKPVPLLLAYWTTDTAADGRVIFSPDIYSRNAPLLQALNRR